MESIQNARLQSISCLRESGPSMSTLQATTEKCSTNRGGGSALPELFQRDSMVGSLLSVLHVLLHIKS